MFQTSLRDISTDSSNSAVELASLKAQLVVEQSKAVKCQSDTAAKTTKLSAKLQVEQRKSEALETRLVQAAPRLAELRERRRRSCRLSKLRAFRPRLRPFLRFLQLFGLGAAGLDAPRVLGWVGREKKTRRPRMRAPAFPGWGTLIRVSGKTASIHAGLKSSLDC